MFFTGSSSIPSNSSLPLLPSAGFGVVWIIELICLAFSVDDFFCNLAHNTEAKIGPTHQVWQSQHGELGRHAFPYLGSCSIGHNFADGTLTSNLTNLSDLSLGRCTCYFGRSICQIHPISSLTSGSPVPSCCCSAP